ncbi:hypothetical protein AURDEDRAFT_151629 [Auricularia subglabra TFB-10046 SS5]|nr:hypothetical protein AURDEDRAFT_151629 [Auricularia subglabra TFB-10046 SS5]
MHAAHDRPRLPRRARSSPDLSASAGDLFAAAAAAPGPRTMLKRSGPSPSPDDDYFCYKRQRVGSLAALAPGTRPARTQTGSRPRGRPSFPQDHYGPAYPPMLSPNTPSLSPGAETPGLAHADSASLASLSPLSDSPLDDVFSPARDLFVSGIHVCTQDRVCASVAGAPAALPTFPLDLQQHPARGTLSPIIPLLSQLSCPAVLAHIGLSIGSDPIASVSSLVTVSSKQELQLRCATSVYAGGVLMASHEDQVLPCARNNVNFFDYSVPLASHFLSRLIHNHERHDTTFHDTISVDTTPSPHYDDTLVVLRFQSQSDHGQKILLVLACQFSLVQSDQGFVKLWRPVLFPLPLSASPLEQAAPLLPSPTILSTSTFAPPFKLESAIDDVPLLAPLPKRLKRPNLTVAIPPADGYLTAVVTATVGPPTGGGLMPAVPSPMPITPLNQLIHTPADPPPLNRDADERKTVRGERYWAPTPTEAAFPASMPAYYFERGASAAAPRTPLDHLFQRERAHTPTFPMSGAPPRLPPAVALASPYKFGFDDLAAKTFDFGNGGARRAAEL